MSQEDLIAQLEDMLQVDAGSLKADTLLETVPQWDSLAAISLIALADSVFERVLEPMAIARAKSVRDLVNLLQG